MSNNLDIETLIVKKISGNITESELLIVDKWIQASTKNESYYKHFLFVWNQTKNTSNIGEPNVEKEWDKLSGKLITKRIFPYSQLLKYAAIAVLLIGLTTFWFMQTPEKVIQHQQTAIKETKKIIENKIETPLVPQKKTIKENSYLTVQTTDNSTDFFIMDSSRVYLEANSSIVYKKTNADQPQIAYLKGEGIFNIASSSTAFIVKSKYVTLHTTGSIVGIKEHDNQVEIFVEEGELTAYQTGFKSNSIHIKANEGYYFDVDKKEFIKTRIKTFKSKLLKIRNKIKNFFKRRKK